MKHAIKIFVLALAVLSSPIASAQLSIKYHEYPGTIIHLPTWAMAEQKLCDKHKIRCEVVYLQSGPLAQQAAAAGSVDVIFQSIDVLMQAVSKGNDLQIVGAQASNIAYVLAARKDLNRPNRGAGYPANMKDFKGLKVGVSGRGSATEIFMRTLLREAGMSPEDVSYVAVGAANTAFGAMTSRQVDAALTWDPVPALCASSETCEVAVDMRRGEGPDVLRPLNGGFSVFAARRDYISKNAAAIDAFMKAVADGVAYVKDPKNFSAVMALARKNVKLGEGPKADQALEQTVKEWLPKFSVHFDRATVAGASDLLINNKVIDKPISAETLVYKQAP